MGFFCYEEYAHSLKKRSRRLGVVFLVLAMTALLAGCGSTASKENDVNAGETEVFVSEADDEADDNAGEDDTSEDLSYVLAEYTWDKEKEVPDFFIYADYLAVLGIEEPEGMLFDAEILQMVWDKLGKPDALMWLDETDDLITSMKKKEESNYYYDLIYEYPEYTLKLYIGEFVFDEYNTSEAKLYAMTYYPKEAWEIEKQMLLEDGYRFKSME